MRVKHAATASRDYAGVLGFDLNRLRMLIIKKPLFTAGLHNALLVFGALGCLYCVISVPAYFFLQYDFTFRSMEVACEQPLNNRCANIYRIEKDDGTIEQSALSNFEFRNAEYKPGAAFKKRRFSFDYFINGCQVHWAYGRDYLRVFLCGMALLFAWYWITPKRPR